MFTLIALGVGAAYFYSLAATVAPWIFPEGFRHMNGSVMPYFDTAVVVTVLILLGQVLELKARSHINDRGKAADKDPAFSKRIREGLPGMEKRP